MLLLWGCASAPASTKKTGGHKDFPSPAELDELATASVVRSERAYDRKVVPEWTLERPLSDVISYRVREASGPLEQVLLAQAEERRAKAPKISEGASCHARQLGLFYLEHEQYPHDGLQSFMSSRCGMATVKPFATTWDVTRDDDESPIMDAAALAKRLEGPIKRVLTGHIASGKSYELGIWEGERQGKRIVVLVVERRYVDLEPLNAQAPEDGVVVLRGESLHDRWDSVAAAFTVGEFEHGRCEAEEGVKAPKFVLRCKLNRGDRDARLDLWGSNEGRVLANGISDLVLWPQIKPEDTYRAPLARALLREVKLDEDAPLLEQALALVNHVRASGGLVPLRASREQSVALGKLVPHFFEADDTIEGDKLKDRLALGFMAGWEITQPVLSGSFGTGAVQRRDLVQWLTSMLEGSNGRRTLLSPEHGILALGVYAQGDAYSFLAVTYNTPPPYEAYGTQLARLSKLLQRARAEAGVPGLVWDRRPEMSEDIVREIEADEISWPDARREFAVRAVTRGNYKREYLWLTSSLEHGRAFVPPALLSKDIRHIDALVVVRPWDAGHPWSVYVVYMLLDN